jgi:hypothetical protein
MLRDAPAVLSLADGDVYDNLGLEWFQGWTSGRPASAEPADFLIVANAGGVLMRTSHPYGGVRGLWRAKDVQYSQTTKLRVRWYVDELVGGLRRGIYVAVELLRATTACLTGRRSTRASTTVPCRRS